MTHVFRRFAIWLVCAALLCAAGLQSNFAQNNNAKPAETAAPKHRLGLVNEYTIRPGLMNEYLEWAKNEARPLYVKAGIKEAYFFTQVYGDRAITTFTEVHDSFAALKARNEAFNKNNSPEALAALSAGANRYIEHTRTFIVETLPELSWRNPKLSSPPPYYLVTTRFVAPQRGRDYEAYLKNDWLPLVKKADANGLLASRNRFGGEGQYTIFTPVNDLADLDQPNPVTRMLGAEAVAKVQQKLVGIVQRTETRVLRLRPEISIIPAPATATK